MYTCECKICRESFRESDLYHGVCLSCIKDCETVGEALEWGNERTMSVEINGFIAYTLSEEQINKILAKWCEENFVDGSADVVEYCELDKFEFVGHIAEKYGD